ncbi:hypothetical protein PI87_26145 [Ralstonia sp. A12]|nr:hypothetical protein PI87_26145 [Ralstonia sp. A12]
MHRVALIATQDLDQIVEGVARLKRLGHQPLFKLVRGNGPGCRKTMKLKILSAIKHKKGPARAGPMLEDTT